MNSQQWPAEGRRMHLSAPGTRLRPAGGSPAPPVAPPMDGGRGAVIFLLGMITAWVVAWTIGITWLWFTSVP